MFQILSYNSVKLSAVKVNRLQSILINHSCLWINSKAILLTSSLESNKQQSPLSNLMQQCKKEK